MPASGFAGKLHHCRIERSRKRLNLWFLKSFPRLSYEASVHQGDLIRRLRLHLFRLHAERECLKQLLRLIIHNKLHPETRTPASDCLQQYLLDSTRLLSRKARYGLSQSKLLDAVQKFEDLVSPGERETLLTHISDLNIRRNIYNNVKKFTIPEPDAAGVLQIIGHNTSVFVGKEQRIGGVTMTNYEMKFGDNTKISGDFVVANTIQNSFNKIAASDGSTELKKKLEELHEAVAEMSNHLSPDGAREAAKDLDFLTSEATSENPRRKWYKMSADGLIKIAKTVEKVGLPVVKVVGETLKLLT